MPEDNKETLIELKSLAYLLRRITLAMRDNYAVLRRFVFQEIYLFLILVVVFAIGTRLITELYIFVYMVFPALIIILLALTIIKLTQLGEKHNQYYIQGREIIKTMSDKAEWTRYKKRLIYRGNDVEVSESVDDFFIVSEQLWSPSRSEKNCYYTLVRLSPIIIITFLIASIVILISTSR